MPIRRYEHTQSQNAQYSDSRHINTSLAIEQQSNDFCILNLQSAKSDICQLKQQQHLLSIADSVKSHLDPLLQRSVRLNSMKCSSLWLTVLPIQEQGFYLNKHEFQNALSLRFGWQLYNVSSHCVCGTPFSVDRAMVCRHGSLTFIHHSELCDLTTGWLHEVCCNVEVEPPLLPLNE